MGSGAEWTDAEEKSRRVLTILARKDEALAAARLASRGIEVENSELKAQLADAEVGQRRTIEQLHRQLREQQEQLAALEMSSSQQQPRHPAGRPADVEIAALRLENARLASDLSREREAALRGLSDAAAASSAAAAAAPVEVPDSVNAGGATTLVRQLRGKIADQADQIEVLIAEVANARADYAAGPSVYPPPASHTHERTRELEAELLLARQQASALAQDVERMQRESEADRSRIVALEAQAASLAVAASALPVEQQRVTELSALLREAHAIADAERALAASTPVVRYGAGVDVCSYRQGCRAGF
jgi:hypothetical protein